MTAATELWFPSDRVVAAIGQPPKHHPSITRRLYEMREGRQKFVSLRVVDEILTQLGLQHLLQLPQEDGGLADIYVEGKQYGSPNRLPKVRQSQSKRVYGSDLERREALRRNWRESKRRARERAA